MAGENSIGQPRVVLEKETKENLIGQTVSMLEQKLVRLGEKAFHGRQLFKWLYGARQFDFELMTDMSKELRAKLADRFCFVPLSAERSQSSRDGTRKFLFRLDDGSPVESVLIPDDDRRTVCLSSQSGCALGCTFCATGKMGLLRDLTAGEIIGQLIYLRQEYGDKAFTNVVFMGMGEPLHNYENLLDSLSIMTNNSGLGISPKRIIVSTSGVTPKIRKLAESGTKVRLALSLHAATQKKREAIMPVARTFGLSNLMEAVKEYSSTTGQRMLIEYVLLGGFNDGKEDIRALVRLLHGITCKVNLLAYNPVAKTLFERPSDEKVNRFASDLRSKGLTVTVRQSRGNDIDAACGQLAAHERLA